eukprot:TRINITY_DN75371_c0_g1_i1.p1 TRINITY_DN75371_c0_g1~~TRINITY_DN75371_c0_g1_i1.p1  ORF type:complete len:444 (+),score=27.71 TRINITY_DN75371_c0_g1_i1:127-1332(+)
MMTVTYYDGDVQEAQVSLEKRAGLVVAANPWLVGRLTKDSSRSPIQLTYPCRATPYQAASLVKSTSKECGPPVFTAKTPYHELYTAIAKSDALVFTGSECLHRDEMLAKIRIVDIGCGSFALVFSLSYVIADGYTYYRILDMFGDGASIAALDPNRRSCFDPDNLIGKGARALGKSSGMTCNIVCNLLTGLGSAQCFAYHVDLEKIRAKKVKGADGIDFVSTNDIITSNYGNMIRARLLLMSMNFRNRTDGLTNELAGNYEGLVYHDVESYSTPSGIRSSLLNGAPFSPMSNSATRRPLPGSCEVMIARWGLITNWASFFMEDLRIAGSSRALHVPVMNLSVYFGELCVIFSPQPQKIAVLYFSRRLTYDRLFGEHCIHGACVSDTLFGDPFGVSGTKYKQ